MSIHFFNGALVPEDELALSPRDLGFSRGYAVFDFLKTYPHHRPFRLVEHVERLFNSAHAIGLEIPWSKECVRQWVLDTLAANSTVEEKFIKITVSGGISDTMLPSGKPTIVILIDPAVEYPSEQYEEGVGVILVKHERVSPRAKSNHYIEGVKRTQEAYKVGSVEPVYYSELQVSEGSNSNIFALIHGELLTPKSNILEGITRSVLLEILKLDIPIEVRNFTHTELLGASEAFLTGSGKEVTPVTSIDGIPLGSGHVGPITKEVMRQFREYTLSDAW